MLFCELWLHDPVCYLRTGVQNLGHPWNFNYWPPLICNNIHTYCQPSLSEALKALTKLRAVAFNYTYNLSKLSISNSTINYTGIEAVIPTFGIWRDTHCPSVQGFHLNFKEL